ncbi:MAG: hypothetical protein AAB439_01285 [Patescibacteria group bacterium]
MKVFPAVVGIAAVVAAIDSLLMGIDFWDGELEYTHFFTRNAPLPLDLTGGEKTSLGDIRSHSALFFLTTATTGSFGYALLKRTFR